MSTLDPEIAEELEAEEDAHGGVRTVEAAEQVFGKYSKWFLFIGCVSSSRYASRFVDAVLRARRIGLASYAYSLDYQTTSNYLPFATSHFGAHSLISSIQVAQSIIGSSRRFLYSARYSRRAVQSPVESM